MKQKKNLLKVLCVAPIFRSLVKHKKHFLLQISDGRLNVEVARLPIVCFDAINRHISFHIKWDLLLVSMCANLELSKPIRHDNRASERTNERATQKGGKLKPLGWETNHKINKGEGARYRLHFDDHLSYDSWLHTKASKLSKILIYSFLVGFTRLGTWYVNNGVTLKMGKPKSISFYNKGCFTWFTWMKWLHMVSE